MSDLLTIDLIDALAHRPLDHANDLRPNVERLLALTDGELANLRGDACPVDDCGTHGCEWLCERCGDRHGSVVEVKPGVSRIVCTKCSRVRHCASCDAALPRYLLVNCDNDTFCEGCCHESPLRDW